MPPKNKIDDLRNHLFETLEALRDEEKPMDPYHVTPDVRRNKR